MVLSHCKNGSKNCPEAFLRSSIPLLLSLSTVQAKHVVIHALILMIDRPSKQSQIRLGFKHEVLLWFVLQRILLDSARPLSTLNVGRGDSG